MRLQDYTVAKACIAQEIQLGSPDHFSLWEGGVWGRDSSDTSLMDGWLTMEVQHIKNFTGKVLQKLQ